MSTSRADSQAITAATTESITRKDRASAPRAMRSWKRWRVEGRQSHGAVRLVGEWKSARERPSKPWLPLAKASRKVCPWVPTRKRPTGSRVMLVPSWRHRRLMETDEGGRRNIRTCPTGCDGGLGRRRASGVPSLHCALCPSHPYPVRTDSVRRQKLPIRPCGSSWRSARSYTPF
jgi:hypothetical protein